GQERRDRVSRDRHGEHAPATVAIRAPHERVRQDRPEVHEGNELPGGLRTHTHRGAEIGQNLPESDEVVPLEEGRDAEKTQETLLVAVERDGSLAQITPDSGLDA